MSKNTDSATGKASKFTFETKSGVSLELNPLPPLLIQEVREAARKHAEDETGGKLDKPTYELTTADGAVETHEHDETTILDNPEAMAAWNAWQAQQNRIAEVISERTLKFILMRGVKMDVPEDTAWIEEQAFFGVQVPENPLEKRFHYIKTEILATTDDVPAIMSQILTISGVDAEVIAAAQATFRDSMAE